MSRATRTFIDVSTMCAYFSPRPESVTVRTPGRMRIKFFFHNRFITRIQVILSIKKCPKIFQVTVTIKIPN